jgi:hypothetical protein
MSLGGEGMWRRKKTGVIAVVAGAVLFVAGLADHAFAAPKQARTAVPQPASLASPPAEPVSPSRWNRS